MRIALIGYGKMGQMIESIAVAKGHEIVLKIHIDNTEDFTRENLGKADVAIEFTSPHSAFANVSKCLEWGVPVVSGSTGWNAQLPEAKQMAEAKGVGFLHASNFSVGVNVFFEVNKQLARLMAAHEDYEVTLREVHHTAKLDAPSGTAVTLAEQVLANLTRKKEWVNGEANAAEQLAIISERVDPAPGTHYVKYSSDIDDIEIIHTAHNRKGFASGAVLAAEFLAGKKGVHTMSEVLGF
ncbi:dihydrodipicolinate reductase [Cnuella takakiae]|uniref:4-hydroxy-tetrahydrodipicolinate reductase n=1 Tax=Cnuella takakiae TaxID=1302690 RepID=A0A1M4VM63_9BACT|nr:4-hydroxy-tetrahydrodipicolinate reductase [Cnuella takakiae]OLY92560.1 4-hydroxy-tetrahydrodipicolinate reductase [Cnuella takakiae]SHE69890.1 dihydrodipicolinate reductase [Cnuella takakiae]